LAIIFHSRERRWIAFRFRFKPVEFPIILTGKSLPIVNQKRCREGADGRFYAVNGV
jgi:hypothetical protein